MEHSVFLQQQRIGLMFLPEGKEINSMLFKLPLISAGGVGGFQICSHFQSICAQKCYQIPADGK